MSLWSWPLTLTPLVLVHLYTGQPHTAMVSSHQLGQSLSALSPALRQYFSRKILYYPYHLVLQFSYLCSVIFRDLQSGNLFTNITIGPYARQGLFFNEYETRNIIRHYVSMVNPRLPLLESPVKHLLVDKEALQRTEGGDNPKNVDDWLARRISDILTDTYYKFSGILQSIQR